LSTSPSGSGTVVGEADFVTSMLGTTSVMDTAAALLPVALFPKLSDTVTVKLFESETPALPVTVSVKEQE
jgi:hypothetical protein